MAAGREEEREIWRSDKEGLGKRGADEIREGTVEIERGERKRTEVSGEKGRRVYGER